MICDFSTHGIWKTLPCLVWNVKSGLNPSLNNEISNASVCFSPDDKAMTRYRDWKLKRIPRNGSLF